MKKKNDRGFTLIELLAVISILALVLSITMYSVTSIIRNAKGKTYLTTINEIEKAASNYITENSSELLFISDDDNTTETQCVSVQDLIDYAFLDNNVINSNVTEDKKVNIGDYIYVERNKTTKTIEKNVYIYDEKTSINSICEATVIAGADINFEVNPKGWSREKNVKITYRVKTNSSFHDIKYGYKYISNSGNDIIPYSSDNVNLKNVTVSEKGTMYADILYEDNKTDGTKVIDKFDTSGPKISLYSDEKKYIRKKVTIPLSIKDCENSDNCSGLKEYTNDELASIISSEKLSVTIGNTKVDKSYLTLSNKESGIFNLVIDAGDTKYNGNVTITIKKDTFFDKTVDEPNGNTETTLESKIIFDNTIPNVKNDSTKTYFVSEQTVTLKCSDDNGISGYYIGNTSPETSDYTEVNNLKNYETTKKITSAGTYYLSCKDSAGNIETNEIKYYNYTLKYMLLTEDGTKGTYSLENYNGVSSNKYLLPENASIVITQINNKINSNIPTGSSSNNYVGYNKVKASSSISNTQTFNIVKKDNINQSDFNINDNLIYMFWFNRNLLNIKYQLAYGETLAPGSYESDKYTWSVDDSYVKRTIISSNTSTITFNSYRYRSGKTEINLYNNSTGGYFAIKKTGYSPKSGEEWKKTGYSPKSGEEWRCTSGCKTNNMTFSQAKYEIDINNNVCDISKNDCDITLRVNWELITYNVKFSSNVSSCSLGSNYSDMSIKYNSVINKDNPTCTGYTFNGWAASGDIDTAVAKYGTTSNPNTTWVDNNKGTYFKNLTAVNDGAVTLKASFSPHTYDIVLDSQSATVKGTQKVYSKYNNGIFLDSEYKNQMGVSSNPITVPTKTGYNFGGYYTQKNGSGTLMIKTNGYRTSSFVSTDYSTSGTTLYAYWIPNKVYIKIHMNGGNLSSRHGSAYGQDGNYATKNGDLIIQSFDYGSQTSSNGLINYNNSSYLNIVKTGYIGKSGAEWNTKADGTGTSYDQNAVYNVSKFCDASSDDCTLTLYVNWIPITYNLKYDLTYGSHGNGNPPTTATYDSSFTLSNPTKTITFKGNQNSTSGANGTGVTIGSNTTLNLKFDGWSFTNSEKYSSDSRETRTSFKNLTSVNNATVTLTANWSSLDGVLPTVSKTGYECGWSTSSGGKTMQYSSGGSYPDEKINANSDNKTINLYAVCKLDFPTSVNGDRCNKDDGNIYYITTCQVSSTENALCNYNKINGKSKVGTVIRSNLAAVSNNACKLKVTYDCQENGGTTETKTASYTRNTSVDLTNKTCTKSDWKFIGWNTNKNATTALDNASNYTITSGVTVYGIYKKDLTLSYKGNGFTIKEPSDADDYGTTCNNNTCTSKCTLYNKKSKCTAKTPDISGDKNYFSMNVDDYTYDSSQHLWEHSTFGLTEAKNGKTYYVPNDKINAMRYRCGAYDDPDGTTRYRLQLFYVTTCNGTNCSYNKLNGLSSGSSFTLEASGTPTWSIKRSVLSDTKSSNCHFSYYITNNATLNCYKGASTSSGKSTTVSSNCKKLSVYRTSMKSKSNGSNSWYYVPDSDCYIDGASLTSTYPSSCSSSTGTYCATFYANGGKFSSGSAYNQVCYNSTYQISNATKPTRSGCTFAYWTVNGSPRTQFLDYEENGKTLYANWYCSNSGNPSPTTGVPKCRCIKNSDCFSSTFDTKCAKSAGGEMLCHWKAKGATIWSTCW